MVPAPAIENPCVAGVAAGAVAFPASCAISQRAQLGLGVHTGTRLPTWLGGARLTPTLLGALTVCGASIGAVSAAERVAAAIDPAGNRRSSRPAAATALTGIACFVGLGGRFWRLSPSCLADLGALADTARGSLPATARYASLREREAIQALGRRFGCHSCGVRPFFSSLAFIADHQPPLSRARLASAAPWRRLLGRPVVSHRFYPQCAACSSKQAALLAERTALARRLGSARRALAAPTTATGAVFHLPSPMRPPYAAGALLAAIALMAPEVLDAAEHAIARARHALMRAASRREGEPVRTLSR